MNIFVTTFLLLSFLPMKKDQSTDKTPVIIDSKVTLEQALTGKDMPPSAVANLVIIDVEYYSNDRKLHRGQLVADKDAADDLIAIFKKIKLRKFPVEKVIPVNKYGWDDNKSMDDNNTSAFNYRTIAGTQEMSKHSLGRAIDINPFLNPEIKGKRVSPAGAKYNVKIPGTIVERSWLVLEFKKRGWQWGGSWESKKDYQHFEKSIHGKL